MIGLTSHLSLSGAAVEDWMPRTLLVIMGNIFASTLHLFQLVRAEEGSNNPPRIVVIIGPNNLPYATVKSM